MIKISKRLRAIGDFVPDGSVLADIGTDHALLIIYLLENKQIEKGYALDIAKKPLEIAKETIKQHNFENKIEVILSDGLESFTGQANCFVMAGMGAETIWKIIEAYNFNENDCLILQANSKLSYLREELSKNSFEIIAESFIIDMKRPYTILKIRKRSYDIPLTLEEILLGPILSKQKEARYIEHIKNRRDYLLDFKKFNQELNFEFKIIDEFLKEHNNE